MRTRRATPEPPRWYEWRSGVFALIYLIGLLGGWAIGRILGRGYLPAFRDIGEHFSHGATICAAAAIVCTAAAVGIRLWASSYLSASRVWSTDVRADALVIAGPFRYCRHPLYAANILLAAGLGSLAPLYGWIFIIAATVVFVGALITREERILERTHEAHYARYRASVPALIPRLVPVAAVNTEVGASLMQGLRTESFSVFIVAGAVSFFIAPQYGWWIFAAAYIAGVIVQRRIEGHRA